MDTNVTPVKQQDVKKIFWKLGTCSHTLFHILNREFGVQREMEERAADALAGGIMQLGHQCGMLWGASLAAGAEAYRRSDDQNQAIRMAVIATQHLMESFSNRTKTVSCREITNCDFSSKLGMAKYLISGKFMTCFNLAENWFPEAVQSAEQGLSQQQTDLSQQAISCASEVAKKMGATDEQTVMVAGFAGGLGLSGNGCGALSAAIWMNTLAYCKEVPQKMALVNPNAENTLKVFLAETNDEILCHKVSGRRFETIEDHAKFINEGGCEKLIQILADTSVNKH